MHLFRGAIGFPFRIIIALLFLITIICHGSSQGQLARTLTNAAKNTYFKGLVNYSLQFTTLSPSGDTFIEIHHVYLKNTKKEFKYTSIRRDTLVEMYFNKLLLRSNSSSKKYKINYFDEEEVRFDFDHIYQPLTDKEFKSNFKGDSIIYTNLYEDANNLKVKVEYLDPGELDEFYFIFTISKPLDLILEYSHNGLIAGIPIYQNYKILKIEYPSNEADSSAVDQNRYYNIINTYDPCLDKIVRTKQENSEDEPRLTLKELQGILPTLNLISTTDDTMQLINNKSEYTLVDFWFRSCFACIKSLPVLKELRNKYPQDFLNIVSINNVDKSISLIDDFVKNNGIPYKIFIKSVEFGNRFDNVISYPTFFIYDKDFNIVKTIEGYSGMLFESIDSVLIK